MIQSALAGDPVLVRLTEAIVARVRPRRIVLFGSRARGDARLDSDYDVMVEEEQEHEDEWKRAHEIRDAIRRRIHVDVQIHVRTPAKFERRREDVGTIDYDIAREGIVLYADQAIPEIGTLRPSSRVREQPELPPESLAEWIEMADADLRTVAVLISQARIDWGIVAFHCQQVAEKYLKAALVSRHVKPMRTHDLEALLLQITAAGYSASRVKAACKRLTAYAVDPRYPGLRVDEAKGQRAVDDCRRIVDEAKRWLSQERVESRER
jgi:HEPN domain-containing protein/predicted nucleotidyltransferase